MNGQFGSSKKVEKRLFNLKTKHMRILAFGYLFFLPILSNRIVPTQIDRIINTRQPTTDDGIVGDWKLALECYDDNHNHQLDDAERKKGFSNHYFYRFSADGGCVISPFAANQLKNGFKGHYTVTTKNGKQVITTFWDEAEQKGQREAQYTVISVSKTELVLLETTGDHTFWIFNRI
jgi:hypothetical protein